MSAAGWNEYIDNIIEASKFNGVPQCTHVCIIGLNGSEWTSTSLDNAVKLSPAEGATIANAIKNNDQTQFQQHGILVGGKKYRFLKHDEDVYYGKLKDYGNITMQKTKQGILIAVTGEGLQVGHTNKAVASIAEYLQKVGM